MWKIALVFVQLFGRSISYTVSIGRDPVCPFISCENNGTLNKQTCSCHCPSGFSGFFCQSIVRPSAWPEGPYGLPASMFGCPETEDKGWSHGYINLTLPLSSKPQEWNVKDPTLTKGIIEPNILGPYHYRALQMNFCIKIEDRATDIRDTWPHGQYCIYSVKRQCPKGFERGSVEINGYRFTESDIGGILPDVVFQNHSLQLFFCCRDDGAANISVTLPNQFPFLLFQGGSAASCQQIKGMEVQQDYFYMTNMNDTWEFDGVTPYMDNVTKNDSVGVSYCYYTPYDRRECYFEYDMGNSYNGQINVSTSGKTCINWKDAGDSFYINHHRLYQEFESNYCRAFERYYVSTKVPVCVVDVNGTIESCNASKCKVDESLKVFGKNKPFYASPEQGENLQEYATDGKIGNSLTYNSYRPLKRPWFQVDLQEFIEVHAIIIHRSKRWFPINNRYFGTYVSKNRWDFMNNGAVRCDDLRHPGFSTVFRHECRRPVIGQFVTVRNFDLTHPHNFPGKFFYMEINEIVILGKHTYGGRPLGIISGNVFDYQLVSSSVLSAHHLPLRGRLYLPGEGWCSALDDRQPWFMVDLVIPTEIQGILIQGWKRGQIPKRIKRFSVMYGITETNLTWYEHFPGTIKIFQMDQTIAIESVNRFLFHKTILGRYLKIVPYLDIGEDACLKMEIVGVQKQLIRDIRCEPGSVDFGFEEIQFASFWLEDPGNRNFSVKNLTTLQQCRAFCIVHDGTAFRFDAYTNKLCSVKFGDRYHPTRESAWLISQTELNFVGHRLCLKGIMHPYSCDFDLDISDGIAKRIKSPGLPFNYAQGLNCTWNIKAGPGMFVQGEIINVKLAKMTSESDLREVGVFDTNPGRCRDRLLVYSDSNSVGKIITSENEDIYTDTIIMSSNREMHVRLESCFNSALRDGEKSFEIKVSQIDKPGCGMITEGCIVTCTKQSAYIATKRFPAKYETGENCLWKIEGQFGQYVQLEIINLDIPDDDSTCAKSYIAVYDIDLFGKENLIGRYCKENRPYFTVISRWHLMRIEFRSGNEKLHGAGFLGRYQFVNFTQEYSLNNSECDDGWYRREQSCYKMFTKAEGITWIQAEDSCINYGGHLVSIGSKDEMSFIHYLVTKEWKAVGNMEIYMGLKKLLKNDTIDKYVWSDGNPLTFTAWYRDDAISKRQPNGLMNERCTSINLYSIHVLEDWHDTACAYDKISNFICEKKSSDQHKELPNKMREIWWSDDPVSLSTDGLYYRCNNSELISQLFLCDGETDCSDESDEINCVTECTSTQFQCKDGSCISISLYCDFIPHCSDGSDESSCVREACNDQEWKCNNKQCIPLTNRCDFKKDCYDGSDEQNCASCNSGFQCYDQTCLHKSQVCDGFIDCSGFFAEDESQNCANNVQRSCTDWWSLGKRVNGEYLINMGLKGKTAKVECRFEKKNNNIVIKTAMHHSEEESLIANQNYVDVVLRYEADSKLISLLKNTFSCSQDISLQCRYTKHNQDASWTGANGRIVHTSTGRSKPGCSCPFVNKCELGKSRCNCNTTLGDWFRAEANEIREDNGTITEAVVLPIQNIAIPNPKMSFPYMKIKVGPLICIEGTPLASNDFLCRSGLTVDASRRCILDYDEFGEVLGCRDLSHLDNCDSTLCQKGYVKCPGSFCIPPRLLCDGQKHCIHGEDEENCYSNSSSKLQSCKGLYRCKRSNICLNMARLCDGVYNCPLRDDELLCVNKCPRNCTCSGLAANCTNVQNSTITALNVQIRLLDLNNNNLKDGLPLLSKFTFLVELHLMKCGIKKLEKNSFEAQKNLLFLDLRHNELRFIAAYAFRGLMSLRTLLLEGNDMLNTLSANSFWGLTSLPVLNLTNTKLETVQQSSLSGMPVVRFLNLSYNKIKRIDDFAFLGLKELTTLDIRGNNIESFSSNIFTGVDSLKSLYSDAYVFCCLKPRQVRQCLPMEDEFSSCDDLMRNNVLRTFLWIIGLSSLLGNVGVLVYKFVFDKRTLQKGHGILIANLSASDLLMGIYMLIIASADQLYRGKYIWNDISWRRSIACKTSGIIATISSETSVSILCLITLDRLIAVRFPFGQFRFTKRKAQICCLCAWFMSTVIALVPLIPGSYFKGQFYSRSAVCLALPLTRDKPSGWEYSTAVFIILNFVIFMVIAFGQLLIYREVSGGSSNLKIKSQRKSQDMAIARGLFLVVISDFLCWFPIGLMGLLALNGHVISAEVYAWAAVFILPINSALNPYLYTFGNLRRSKEFLARSLKKTADRTLSASTSVIDWTDLCDNDLFVIGKKTPVVTTLDSYIHSKPLSVLEMKIVVTKLAEAMQFLHERNLVHGQLTDDLVVIDVHDGVITDASVKVVPKPAEEMTDIPDDILALGQITMKMLRNYQGYLTKS